MSGAEAAAIDSILEAVKGGICFFCARAEYFDDLETQLDSFRSKISRLKDKKEDIETKIKNQKTAQMQPVYEVSDWLKRVNSLQKGAEKIIKEAEEEIHNKALRWFCPKHCCSYNRVGNRVIGKVKQVSELIDEGNNFNATVVEERIVDLVNEIPVPEIVGLELMVKEIWRMIEDPRVRIIGIHGMGGVGKTTLLKKMYNEICHRDYVVIWVENPQVEAAQEAIGRSFEIEQPQEFIERAVWNSLRRVKYVLMLDNLGEEWDHQLLEEIGVPLNDNRNGSKIIITTRSEKVCDAMKATKIKLNCLPKETAIKLFKLHVGEATLNANWKISELAEDIANACDGFPLLLTTTGRAMAGKTNVNIWKREKENLKNQLAKVTNVEDHVFPVLKVSYDNLSNNTLRKCFLYFPLFSEGDDIKKKEVIELWKAEGYLDELNEEDTVFNDAKAKGENILQSLMRASLLETGKSLNFVKIHEVIREMTLWLACEKGKEEDKVLVRKKALNFSKWTNAEKISLQDPSIKSLPEIPSCHILTTLLVRGTNLERLPSEFFKCMPALRVLSLSDNELLVELPVGIENLSNLHYLNLSGTCIQILPMEVQNLKKLQTLILDREILQLIIPEGVVSGLSSLQVFSMFDLVHFLQDRDIEVKLLEELECLENVTQIELTISIASFVEKVLNTGKLRKYIKQLQLVEQSDVQKLSLTTMEHLERLELLKCSSVTEVEIEVEHEGTSYGVPNYLLTRQKCFPNLCYVRICDCPIKNVTCLVYVGNLVSLKLIDCSEIVEVISEDFGPNVLKRLVELSLKRLPKLKSIYCNALEFPSLSKLVVYDCSELQSLPLDSRSGKNLKQIKGSREWWNNLRWNEIAIEHVFSQKLQDTQTDPVSKLLKVYMPYNHRQAQEYSVRGGTIKLPPRRGLVKSKAGPSFN